MRRVLSTVPTMMSIERKTGDTLHLPSDSVSNLAGACELALQGFLSAAADLDLLRLGFSPLG